MELWRLRLISRVNAVKDRVCIRKDGSVNRRCENFLWGKVSANAKPIRGVSTVDVVVDFEKDVWVRLFIPNKEISRLYCIYKKSKPSDSQPAQPLKSVPIIFFYHGGGFVFRTPDCKLYDIFCRRLARKCHALVIAVNYRRAPEHKFPSAYDDCYAALQWLQCGHTTRSLPRHINPACIDLSRVYLCGDDAGGNIAHHVAVRAVESGDGDGDAISTSPVSIKGLLLLSPLFGGQDRTAAETRSQNRKNGGGLMSGNVASLDWQWKAFLPHGANRDHPACNIFGRNSPQLAGVALPPVLVIIGGLDVLQDWEMRYADGLNRAGKDVKVFFYKGGVHTFGVFNQARIAKEMFLNIAGFIDNH